MVVTSEPISSEKMSSPALPKVPAIPATVATSFFLKRSDDIVMTVTDSVWCAKPAGLLKRHADQAAEEAAQIGGQERQPREQRDLLQVHLPDAAQVQRQPEGE